MRLALGQVADVRLGRQRAPQYEAGDHVIPYLRSANVADGSLDLTDVKSMNFAPSEQIVFRLEPGDVLLTEGSGSRSTVGTSAVWRDELEPPVCFQNTLLRLRPRPGVTDGRFLAWWARHARTSGQIAAVSSGANILHIGSDGLKRLIIQTPTIDEQRRIADFLDDRVSRIDRIIAARREQAIAVGLLHRRILEAAVDELLETHRSTRLGRVAKIRSGDFLPASDFHADGRFEVVGGNGVAGAYTRPNVRAGTIAIGRVGALCGNVHFLSEDAWLTDNALGVELRDADLDPRFVAAVLDARHLNSLAYKTAQPLLTGSQIADQMVPIGTTKKERSTLVGTWIDSRSTGPADQLDKSVSLLTEYKSSLITAAVTRELDVTTAGSGIKE